MYKLPYFAHPIAVTASLRFATVRRWFRFKLFRLEKQSTRKNYTMKRIL